MNIPILTNAHLAPIVELTETTTMTITVTEIMIMAEIIMKVAVQDIPITALTVAPGVVRQAVDMSIIVGDSGHADFGM